MFLYTLGLKEWAVWNWMLRKKSENQLYSHTSPHYGRAAPSAPQIFPDCSIKTCPSQQERLSSNSTVKELPLCEYLLVTTLDLQAVLLSPSSNSASLCYETKLCCHNYTPPPPTHTQS